MERYPKYKDSGIKWIGDIPEHWKISKFGKNVTKLTNGYVGPVRKIMRHSGVPYIQGIHIKETAIEFTPKGPYYVSKEWSDAHEKSILKKDDVLFVQTGEIGKVGIVPEEFEGANCHALIITRPNESIISKYLYYYFTSNIGHYILNRIRTGEILHHINGSKLKAVHIIIPNVNEQKIITHYLDRKTTEIDQLIADKKRLVKLYKEEKTALINQAVTKGIDPNAPMKDSGIEWLGEIPEHWQSTSLKWYANIYSGGTPSKKNPEYWKDGTIPWLNSGTVNQWDITTPSEYITQEALENSSAKWIPEKSILMALAGQGKTKGMVAQVHISCTCNQSMAVIVPNEKLHNRFLLYWLKRNYQNIRNLGGGDKRDGINLEMIGGIPIPLFSIEEQKEITEFIEKQIKILDNKIVNANKYIDLITEYRTALISEVVTGKIKVTNTR